MPAFAAASAFAAVVVAAVANGAAAATAFSYRDRDPTTWWFFYPEHCDSLLFPVQSPVALDAASEDVVEAAASSIGKVVLEGWDAPLETVRVENDGAGVLLRPKWAGRDEAASVRGGPLTPGRRYRLDRVLWHWGENDTVGSEHIIDGKRSPAEVQFMLYNDAYLSYEAALPHEDGVVGLAFHAETVDDETEGSTDYGFLRRHLADVVAAGSGSDASAAEVPTARALLGVAASDMDEYFTYHGSLTRPPCVNTVTWVVFTAKLRIAREQLRQFSNLRDARGRRVVRNYRGEQPLAGRTPVFRRGTDYAARREDGGGSAAATMYPLDMQSLRTFLAYLWAG